MWLILFIFKKCSTVGIIAPVAPFGPLNESFSVSPEPAISKCKCGISSLKCVTNAAANNAFTVFI